MNSFIRFCCISVFIVLISRCNPLDLNLEHQGIITGLDYRKCACQTPTCGCCGAYIVEINKEAYYFYKLPKESGIVLDAQPFVPVPVSLNFIYDPESCGPAGKYILITAIQKR